MSEFSTLSKAGYEAIAADDLDAFLEVSDKKVEFISLVEGRSYKGHKGVREWWDEVLRALGGLDLELDEVTDLDDHGYVKLIAKANNSEIEMPDAIWQAARVKKGKITWWGSFGSEAEARDALGID
jgi:SnoaL-like domain